MNRWRGAPPAETDGAPVPYFFDFFIVSTTAVDLCDWACLTVVNRPVLALRPIFMVHSFLKQMSTGLHVLPWPRVERDQGLHLLGHEDGEGAQAKLASVNALPVFRNPRAKHVPLTGRW